MWSLFLCEKLATNEHKYEFTFGPLLWPNAVNEAGKFLKDFIYWNKLNKSHDSNVGVVPKASPQVAVEMSLDDMLEELQMMDKKKEGGADKPHPPASPSKDPPSTAHKLDALLVELST